MQTPQGPSPALVLGEVQFFLDTTVAPFGFFQDEVRTTSSTSGITYRFSRLTTAAKNVSMIPVYVEGLQGVITVYYIFSQQLPALLKIAPVLAQFPQTTPGFQGLDVQSFSVVAPQWCIQGLLELETQYSAKTGITDMTMVLREDYKSNEKTRIVREPSLIPSIKRAYEIPNMLGMKAEVTGNPPVSLTGEQALSDPNASKFVQEKQIPLRPGSTVNIIGRLQCLDLISLIVVPPVQPSVEPGFVPSGFVPPPSGFTQQPPIAGPAGFVQQPQGSSQLVTQRQMQLITLPSGIKDRIAKYLLSIDKMNQPTRISGLTTAIRKIVSERNEKYFEKGGYINLSSKHIIAKTDSKKFGDSYGMIQGLNYPLRLLIPTNDLDKEIIGDEEKQAAISKGMYSILRDSIMMEISNRINAELGDSLVAVNDAAGPVPSSILDGIPAGPSPSARPRISAKTPFADIVPLPGVSDVTVPITNGTRCVPGLMTKKRD